MIDNHLIDNRQIRVFISSTFQDMQDERDYLMKRTFPKLRKLAAERDVTLTELDLRWGITEEEAKTGKVVEICLREIENSIPFFIGIIGNRYGWVPQKDDLSANVTERFPDVNTFIGQHLSVTEMEMQFGVLQREEDMHAYFYIKDKMEKQDNPEMLNRLKAEVEASRYPSSTYSSPENLAEQVEQAFIALLDQLFPEGNISELEKERIGQRSFMHLLCQNYIRDEKNFKVIDDWMQDWEQHQMVITGASGLGKSALMANWVNEKLQDKDRGYNIIYHFTGNGGSESSHEQIMKVLIDEINDVYGWEPEKELNKSQEDKLNELFIRVASKGKKSLLIVLDAINQIIDTDNAKLLNWLPFPPKNIKILFSTLEDDRTMEVFKNRHYPTFVLQPISLDHRKQLINEYLHLYGKKLKNRQIERIANDSQCENTLVLKTLLEELINFGIYEKLDEKIDYYLSQDTIEDFYQALLHSYENEYGKDIIKYILSLIALTKNGLSESEILSITEVPSLCWSQLFCALSAHLSNKNGLIAFSHIHILNSTIKRNCSLDKEFENSIRRDIIKCFKDYSDSRHVSEISWHYYKLKDIIGLHDYILEINRFLILCDEKVELIHYWHLLYENGYNMSEYKPLLKEHSIEVCLVFSWICRDYLADYDNSLQFALLALEKANISGTDKSTISSTYKVIGLIYQKQGNYEKALEYHQKDITLWENTVDDQRGDLSTAYGNLGTTYYQMGDYEKALEYHNKALQTSISFGEENAGTDIHFHNVGLDYYKLGDYQKACDYINKAITIREELYGCNSEITAESYNAASLIHADLHEYEKSHEYAVRALDATTNTYGNYHPMTAQVMDNIGTSYGNLGDYSNLLKYKLEALKIREQIMGLNHPKTAESMNNVGRAYGLNQDFNSELEYEIKSASILESHLQTYVNPDLFTVYDNIAKTYSKLHDNENARIYYEKRLEFSKSLWGETSSNTALALNDYATILVKNGNYKEALQYSSKALEIRRSIYGNEHAHTAMSYCNTGAIYAYLGDYETCADYITSGAAIYATLGRYKEALDYYQNVLEIRKAIFPPDHKYIQETIKAIDEINKMMKS
ncbi:nephrocystin-3 [Prevotella sp. khp1]|uniref:tetratricopeptide repeat protein n=1 Tax=Prevotellaceae TaxID=171552 RepID=UPI000884899D|nr:MULTISPECIES: tetratricopeptide repeat protein [Prevotellaceae]QVJ81667.1 tetratricopeptide repeat protein [Xylanibacter ruminicola]SDQ55512.1 nephrocystin-3 [Prevotella sp. khp1]